MRLKTEAGEVIGVEVSAVTRWLEQQMPGVRPPLTFEPVSGGMSNLTYKVSDNDGNRYIFRRPPVGKLVERAHDVQREHRIMAALRDTEVPVPAMVGLCTDHAVTGADFYMMHFVDGTVMFDPESAEQALDERGRRRAAEQLVDVLVKFQAVDPSAVDLGDLGKPDGYIARQILYLGQTDAKCGCARSVAAHRRIA